LIPIVYSETPGIKDEREIKWFVDVFFSTAVSAISTLRKRIGWPTENEPSLHGIEKIDSNSI
jgi:hypothetical protein